MKDLRSLGPHLNMMKLISFAQNSKFFWLSSKLLSTQRHLSRETSLWLKSEIFWRNLKTEAASVCKFKKTNTNVNIQSLYRRHRYLEMTWDQKSFNSFERCINNHLATGSSLAVKGLKILKLKPQTFPQIYKNLKWFKFEK